MVAVRQAGGYGGRGSFRYSWNGRSVLQDIMNAGERAANQVGQDTVKNAQARAPVSEHGSHGNEPGYLRDHIGYMVRRIGSGWVIVLYSEAPYSVFVILGTSRMEGRDFLRLAADQEFPKYAGYARSFAGGG